MRTNIVIDDKLMADVMAYGDFKTKREAVEEGLRMLKRRKVYDGLLALQGQLQWDDSDEGWARWRAQQQALKAAGEPYDRAIDAAEKGYTGVQALVLQEPEPPTLIAKARKKP
ncbi:type II toxin-antitoxin system VapB family antitoxin [Limnohabitans sp.]|uniref:type II toxin-antitoxin system VapB family antitoxin n=1 Tax=Limnohabitans sp. TaxID=1907725 RepID=UPI00334045B6